DQRSTGNPSLHGVDHIPVYSGRERFMQTRRWCAALIVALCVTVPVSAELKYTYKMTMKKVEGPAPQGMFAAMGDMMGPMIDQVFGGADGVDVIVTVHQDG